MTGKRATIALTFFGLALILFCAFQVAVSLRESGLREHDDLTSRELIEQWLKNQERMVERVVKSNTLRTYESLRTGEYVWSQREAEYRTDGDRVDLIASIWDVGPDGAEIGPQTARPRRRTIFNGEGYYEFNEDTKIPSANVVCVGSPDHVRQGFECRGMPGGSLWGFFPGNAQSLADVLEEAFDVQTRTDTDSDTGAESFVLEVSSPQGHHTIWFDPEHGYNISRAELRKEGEDTYNGTPITAPLTDGQRQFRKQFIEVPNATGPLDWNKTSFVFALNHVDFQQIDGVWVPISGEWEATLTYADGRLETGISRITVDEVDLSPDFNAMQAFVPDVPDGTRRVRVGRKE